MRPVAPAALLLPALLGPLAAQTPVALPHGTGTLTVPAGWTTLSAADLAAERRPGDPADEPARSLLLAAIAAVRDAARTTENVVLHQPGLAAGELRLINAYSAEVEASSEQLRSAEAVDRIRDAIDQVLEQPGVEVVFHGSSEPELFPVPCLALTFRIDGASGSTHSRFVIVPAGERLQYFETMFAPGDIDALAAIDAVLRTFDGAAEPPADDVLRKMLIGGAAGAIAGMAVAVLRRRRRGPRAGPDDADPPRAQR